MPNLSKNFFPHQMIAREPGARVVGLHIPLAWFLQWELPRHLVDRVLGLDVLIDRSGQQPCSDLALFRNWVKLAHDPGSLSPTVWIAPPALLYKNLKCLRFG